MDDYYSIYYKIVLKKIIFNKWESYWVSYKIINKGMYFTICLIDKIINYYCYCLKKYVRDYLKYFLLKQTIRLI